MIIMMYVLYFQVGEALQLYDVVSKQKNEAYKTVQELTSKLTIKKYLYTVVQNQYFLDDTFYNLTGQEKKTNIPSLTSSVGM